MIELSNTDKRWIKLCKGHYKTQYPWQGEWVITIKPLFTELYGWNPDEDNNYHDYLNCLFNRLFDLYLKIQFDQSGHNQEIKNLFASSFYKTISNESELPIERAIHTLCGLIQFNQVIVDGKNRYEL